MHNNPFCYKDSDGQFALAVPIIGWTFGIALSPMIVPTLGLIATATVVYSAYQLATYLDGKYNQIDTTEQEQIEEKQKSPQADAKKKPRYCGKELGNDPTKSPSEEFKWRGRGAPETGKGSWVKNDGLPTEESLHPDIYHPPPKAPHWDYVGPEFPQGAELYLDGSWKLK